MPLTVQDSALGLRERKKRATHQALQRAALELVAKHGLAQVTVEDIAAAADTSARTFFNYFASKEDALFASDPSRTARATAAISQVEPGASPFTVVRTVLVSLMEERQRDPSNFKLRRRILDQEPELSSSFLRSSEATQQSWIEALHQRFAHENLDPGHLELIVAVVWSATGVAMHEWALGTSGQSLAQLLNRNLDQLATGFERSLSTTSN